MNDRDALLAGCSSVLARAATEKASRLAVRVRQESERPLGDLCQGRSRCPSASGRPWRRPQRPQRLARDLCSAIVLRGPLGGGSAPSREGRAPRPPPPRSVERALPPRADLDQMSSIDIWNLAIAATRTGCRTAKWWSMTGEHTGSASAVGAGRSSVSAVLTGIHPVHGRIRQSG